MTETIDFASLQTDDSQPGRGTLIAVVSGKDGVGKSTVAANLAVLIAQRGVRTALIDLDLQFGDQALMFRLPTYPCLDDVIANADALTPGFLVDCMHQTSGISVLTAPPSPESGDMVTVDHLRLLFTVLRRQFDFCILDISSHLGDATLEVIEESDRLLMITSGRLPSLKDTKRLLKVMADLGIRADRISIIWNRMFGVDLRREVIEASIKFPVATELPAASEALLEAITDGVPLVLKDPRSSFARALKPLAQTIVGDRLPTAEAAGSARAPMKRLLFARGGATA